MAIAGGAPLIDHRSAESTFRRVVEAHARVVRRRLRRLRVPERDLFDMSQEVFMVVHRKLERGADHASLPALINGVCVRVASAYHRCAYNRRCAPSHDRSSHAGRDFDPSPEDQLHRRRLWALVSGSIRELDDDQRAIVVMHDLDESAMSDVAQILGCPLQTAYSRRRAAFKTMQLLCERARSGC
jgi:RNA polymerase sigma-70 factor (ECF subfamily)